MKRLLLIPCLLSLCAAANASDQTEAPLTEIDVPHSFFGRPVQSANVAIDEVEGNPFRIKLQLKFAAGAPKSLDFAVTNIQNDCGSVILTGSTETGTDIELVDNRTRVCDERPYATEVTMTGLTGKAYLSGERLEPIANPPTCMAYWTGAIYRADKRECQMVGTSGCSNPFRFATVAQCEDAAGLR